MILLKKQHHFLVFVEGVQLSHNQVLGLEDRTFHREILSKLYRNSKIDILVNFNFILSTSKNF